MSATVAAEKITRTRTRLTRDGELVERVTTADSRLATIDRARKPMTGNKGDEAASTADQSTAHGIDKGGSSAHI